MEIAIDTVGDMAGVGLSREGVAVLELRWSAPRRQNADLMPAVDEALRRTGTTRADLSAVIVCTGPGSYMGVRVGVATAKGFAEALDLPLVGVGRLALDAWPHRGYDGAVVAAHRAGRREWAWAAYRWDGADWAELIAPRLDTAERLAAAAPGGALLCGEHDEALVDALGPSRVVSGESASRRPAALCELGWLRLQREGPDDRTALAPLYLREPAIGPQQ